MSKELTVEAKDFIAAIEKVQAMMAEPIPYKELRMTRVYYDDIRKDGKQFCCKMG